MNLQRDDITSTTPLRLDKAVRLAFPAGGMTVSGLRTERRKGNLVVMMLAGKEFTTLAAIEDMLCRAQRKAPASISGNNAMPRPSGSSETERLSLAQAAGLAKLEALSKRSQTTSPTNTHQSGGNVLSMKSR